LPNHFPIDSLHLRYVGEVSDTQQVKWYFNREVAEKKYKLKTSVFGNFGYAFCPICGNPEKGKHEGGFLSLEDALSHCSRKGTPKEEEKKEQFRKTKLQKLLCIMKYKNIIEDERFAIISENESIAIKWRTSWGVKKENTVFLTPQNINSISLSQYNVIFFGKDFQSNVVFAHPKVQKEYYKQISNRPFEKFAYYEDQGSFSEKPVAYVIPIDYPEDVDTLIKERQDSFKEVKVKFYTKKEIIEDCVVYTTDNKNQHL